jgi:hypothetical protein
MNGWQLKAYASGNHLDEHEVMMYLRDTGCISDNCIGLRDIADADAQVAFNWMQYYKRRINERTRIPKVAKAVKPHQGPKNPTAFGL